MSAYAFSNVLGNAYKGGGIEFSEDGDLLYSSQGNRIALKSLASHLSHTLNVEMVENVDFVLPLASPKFALVADCGGRLAYVNVQDGMKLSMVNVGGRVTACRLSPSKQSVAVATLAELSVWRMPTAQTGWKFIKVVAYKAHSDRVRNVRFSPDAKYVITASADRTVKIHAATQDTDFSPVAFVDAGDAVLDADWSKNMKHVFTFSARGKVMVYDWRDDEMPEGFHNKLKVMKRPKEEDISMDPADDFVEDAGRAVVDGDLVMKSGWWFARKSYILPGIPGRRSHYTSADFHRSTELLTAGNEAGELAIVQLKLSRPALAINDDEDPASYVTELARCLVDEDDACYLNVVKFNSDAEWIGFGSGLTGTLGVWEWRSESYVLKEKHDLSGVTAVAFQASNIYESRLSAPPLLLGSSVSMMASGCHDGRVTVWDSVSGYELKTFNEHSGPVVSLKFTNQQHTLVSCSKNGEVRCYELMRMKCFRAFSAPTDPGTKLPHQLTGMSVDVSGELIALAAQNGVVFLFSMATGKIVDQFTAARSDGEHSELGVLTHIQFTPCIKRPGLIATSALDGSICVWDCYGRENKGGQATILMNKAADSMTTSAAMSLCWHPLNSHILCVSYAGGQLVEWDVESEEQILVIDGARDIEVGNEGEDGAPMVAGQKRRAKHGTESWMHEVDPNVGFSSIVYNGNGDHIMAIVRRSCKVYVYTRGDKNGAAASWRVTNNQSLTNLLKKLNPKLMIDGGANVQELDLSDDEEDEFVKLFRRKGGELPGTRFGPLARLKMRKRLYLNHIAVSSDSRILAVATTQGVFCYELSVSLVEQSVSTIRRHGVYSAAHTCVPVHLDEKTTQQQYVKCMSQDQIGKALLIALNLNHARMIAEAYRRMTKREQIELIAAELHIYTQVPALLQFIRTALAAQDPLVGNLLDLHLMWVACILNQQKHHIEKNSDDGKAASMLRPVLLAILKELQRRKEILDPVISENIAFAEFLAQ